ncbi:hypothetical protein IFR05_006157 [Cadophora sp. M221]|nr:hypothetical protein IFR05_006157 [Cadophora sp. M221]
MSAPLKFYRLAAILDRKASQKHQRARSNSISNSSTLAFAMDPSLLCKAFFCLGTAIDIGGTLVPSFREHIMNYGSRRTVQSNAGKKQKTQSFGLIEYVASIQVPHTWFTHYYVISVASSIFWAFQIYTRGAAFEFLAAFSQPESMTVNQAFLAWLFMAFQGTRRLYESLTLTKPSQSKMWVGLWLIGMAYYIFIGVSVWIEGAGMYLLGK